VLDEARDRALSTGELQRLARSQRPGLRRRGGEAK
jgi:hypothetical protein